MKKQNSLLWICMWVACLLLAFGFWFVKERTTTSGRSSQSALDEKTDSFLSHVRSNGTVRHHKETLFVLEAYDAGDEKLLRERVQQLVDEDFDKALEVFSKLDYTHLEFDMDFPHDVIATYLTEHHTGEESMELLAQYCKTSSITASTMALYFENWYDRDPLGQFAWFKKNSTFTQPLTLLKYGKKIGNAEKGIDVLRLVDDLPEDDVRKAEVYTDSMEHMSSGKPDMLGEYLGELEEIPTNAYSPIYNMSERLIRNETDNPQQAMERAAKWIEQVKDDNLQVRYLATTASHLGFNHPDAYQKWLERYEFKDEKTKQLFLGFYDEELAFLKGLQPDAEADNKIEASSLTGEFSE